MARAQQILVPTLGSARWMADYTDNESRTLAHFPAKVDATQFVDRDAVKVKLTANANAGAVALTITAITFTGGATKIPAGTTLDFGGAKVARTTVDYTGGTSVTVSATPTNMVIGDTAIYAPFGARKAIASGTLVGRSYTQRDASGKFHPALITDDEIYLTAFEIVDATLNDNVEFYNHGLAVKQNFLPKWSTDYAVVNEVQTVAITGVLTGGTFSINDGKGNNVAGIAYNANLATIQAGLDTVYGAGNTVASGTLAALVITFQGTLAATVMNPVDFGISALTGATGKTVTRTTHGGNDNLTMLRSKYKTITGI